MLTVVDWVDKSVFELVVTAEKFWFDEVYHGEVLVEVVLKGQSQVTNSFFLVSFSQSRINVI